MKAIFIIGLVLGYSECFSQVIEFSKIGGAPNRTDQLIAWHRSQKFEIYGDAIGGGFSVTLLGGVERPGIYRLKGGDTLHDLLQVCGKLDRMASSWKIKITNLYSNDLIQLSMQSFSKDNDALLPAMRFVLKEGDLVYIPVRIE